MWWGVQRSNRQKYERDNRGGQKDNPNTRLSALDFHDAFGLQSIFKIL